MKVNLDILAIGQSEEVIEEFFLRFPEEDDSTKMTLSGTVILDNSASGVLISGQLRVSTNTECSNCLEDFELVYQADIEIFVDREASDRDDEKEDWIICQRRGVVDITDTLRDATMLSRPQRIVCDQDCKGFCVECGTNLNRQSCDCETEIVDPRWDALPQITKEEENGCPKKENQ
jgi:uncharacterized protein